MLKLDSLKGKKIFFGQWSLASDLSSEVKTLNSWDTAAERGVMSSPSKFKFTTLDFNSENPYKQVWFMHCNFVTFHFLMRILPQILLPEQGTPGGRQAAWSCTPGYAWQGSSLEGIWAQKEINSVPAFE